MSGNNSIAILGGFRLYKFRNRYSINYWHYVYINFLSNRFREVYLIAPTLEVESQIEDLCILDFPNLIIKEMPYYEKYIQGIKLFRYHFKNIKELKNVGTFFCQVPGPYSWMPKLLFRKKCIIEYIGDSVSVMWRNVHYGLLYKCFLIICYLPEYFLSIIAARLSMVYTCGVHLQKKLGKFGVKSTALVASLLTAEDFYEKEFKFSGNLLYVGFIRYAKGLETIVDAISILKKMGFEVRLDIVGDGEFKDELVRIVRMKDMDDDIVFHGHISDRKRLREFYRKSDVFLFPSLSEGSPRVVLEAMANSLPVVSTPVGALPYIFQNDKHIKYAEFNNAESFAAKVVEYVSDANTTKMITREAYREVRDYYTLERFLSTLFETRGR